MTIHFPDLSHHKITSLAGAVALITKATQGQSFVDPSYAEYRYEAMARRIPFAGFHWVDDSDLAGQARNAYRVMGNTPCMWDAEAAGATVPRLVELTHRYRALGGNPTLVYLPEWWWRDHLGSPDLRPLKAAGLSLVSSRYPAGGYTETGPGWRAYGNVTPVIWQWTNAQPFNGLRVDFNAFKGSVTELAALFAGVPPSIIESEATMFTAQVQGNTACWLSDGFKYRVIVDGGELKNLAAAGARHVVFPNRAELDKACGRPVVTGEPDHVTLTAEQLAAIAALVPAGTGTVDLNDVDLHAIAEDVADELRERLSE